MEARFEYVRNLRRPGGTLGSRLPVPPTSFVGRACEITEGCALLVSGRRLVTLTGPGGVGKTRLAIRIAEELLPEFRGDIAFVSLATIADSTLVAPMIAQALDVRESHDRPVIDRLIDELGDRRMLLVLDNFEQVVDAAPLISRIVGACSGLAVLVTSRIPLHLSAEQLYPVLPLPLPDLAQPPEGLVEIDAVKLFAERARAVDPAFALVPGNAAAVAAVCVRLDGLPLAIELAAAKSHVLPPSALLGRLDRRLPVLIGGARDVPARLRTMRDAIAWSYDLLAPDNQAPFRRLSVFVGGFTAEAAAEVVDETADLADVYARIVVLAEQSLLQRLDVVATMSNLEPRLGMLETVREFGLERLSESGEALATRERHARWCLALAEQAEPRLEGFGGEQALWLARLDAELGNLRAAFAWFREAGDARALLRTVAILDVYWFTRPYVYEARHWLEIGLEMDGVVPADVRGMALHVLLSLCALVGDHEAALKRGEEELALARSSGAPFLLGRAHYGLGIAWEVGGDAERAGSHYAKAVPLLRQAGADSWVYLALAGLGGMRQLCGDAAGALSALDEALMLARRCDPDDPQSLQDRLGLAVVLGQRGHVALVNGDRSQAVGHFAECIATAQEIGANRLVLGAMAGLAGAALAAGDAHRAARLLGAVHSARVVLGAGRPEYALYTERITADTRSSLRDRAFSAEFEKGRSWSFAEAIADALAVDQDQSPSPHHNQFRLTARERDVLCLLVDGMTDREIAERLYLSRRTVTTHTSNLFAKLGVSSRTEAASFAVRHGLV